VRDRAPERSFDLVTLHNNIYYFPVDERVAVFAHVGRFLRPGGRLVVTTGCAGGSVPMQLLDLWGAATRGCGRLPAPGELEAQMRQAGFASVASHRLLPGESYFSFVGEAS
jgi:SAM-dependent methyltransferase